MATIWVDGRLYNAIAVDRLDGVLDHPFIKPLKLVTGTLAWLSPGSLHTGIDNRKRPLVVEGLPGTEVVFVDRLHEMVLCIETDHHPKQSLPWKAAGMRTSEVRRAALRLAYELYEGCSGELTMSTFDVDAAAEQLGLTQSADTEAVFSYLMSSRIMESPYLGAGHVARFTDYGISVIESGIDRPQESVGPFPPLNVVVGNIGEGAQVAIGSGYFAQESHNIRDPNLLRDLVPLIRAAECEQREAGRDQLATLLQAAENEAKDEKDCDENFLKATFARFAKATATVIIEPATQVLLAYCKAQGLIP